MDPTLFQNIFGSLSPGLQSGLTQMGLNPFPQPGQSAGAGMPMNILPQVAQQTGNSSNGDMSNFLLKLAQSVQQNNQGLQVAPLQMPQPNYGMLSGLLGKMV